MSKLPELEGALNDAYPQLKIHKPELFRKIKQYQKNRKKFLGTLKGIENESKETVRKLITQAKTDCKSISESAEDLRDFLEKVFPFPDIFEQ